MKKKAQLETLKKTLAKAGKWDKDNDILLTDYWTREEYEAAEEIVNGILEEMTKESMKNTELMAEGRGTFKDSTDLDRTEVIRTLPEDMTPTMRMGLMEHNWTEEPQEKLKRVITYLSRSINAFEKNYPPIHLEALAIVWRWPKLSILLLECQ